jgi:hypothetical protein
MVNPMKSSQKSHEKSHRVNTPGNLLLHTGHQHLTAILHVFWILAFSQKLLLDDPGYIIFDENVDLWNLYGIYNPS